MKKKLLSAMLYLSAIAALCYLNGVTVSWDEQDRQRDHAPEASQSFQAI